MPIHRLMNAVKLEKTRSCIANAMNRVFLKTINSVGVSTSRRLF